MPLDAARNGLRSKSMEGVTMVQPVLVSYAAVSASATLADLGWGSARAGGDLR